MAALQREKLAPPPHDAGRLIGVDMGGSLVKLVFLQPNARHSECSGKITETITSRNTYGETGVAVRDSELAYEDKILDGTVHFIKFPSDNIERAVAFIQANDCHVQVRHITCAGGGSLKFAKLFKEKLDIELVPADELAVITRAISWLTEHQRDEVYEVLPHTAGSTASRRYLEPTPLFPYLLVNIGTGVSIVKVLALDRFQRVSGTALGGGAYWGLCQLLTDCKTWEEAMDLAALGNADDVNVLVRDIYGGDYTMSNGAVIDGQLTAGFFGKVGRTKGPVDKKSLLAALTTMISQSICQVAYLNARIHKTSRVIFTGNYLRRNPIAEITIASSFKRASIANVGGKEMRALFLRHEGYFGALGSLLEQIPLQSGVAYEHCLTRSLSLQSDMNEAGLTRSCSVASVKSLDMPPTVEFMEEEDFLEEDFFDFVDHSEFFHMPLTSHVFSDMPHKAESVKNSVSPETRQQEDALIFRVSCGVAGQIFCNALVQTDVPDLLMELLGNDPGRYAAFASRQASLEKVADLVFVAASCALSDRFGRRPLQIVSGGFVGIVWNLLCVFLLSPVALESGDVKRKYRAPRSVMALVVFLKMLHSLSNAAFLAVTSSTISDACRGSPEKMAAASAATQSYLGLAVIAAPLVAVRLRTLHRRAPFVACAALCAVNSLQACGLPETLARKERVIHIAWAEVLNPLASATLLLRQAAAPRLRALCIAYSLVSIVRCADTVLQAFTRKSMGWGKDESARLLSFWGATVFLGSQTLRKALKRVGPGAAVRIGIPFLALQELLKSLASSWWHLPGSLIVGLPSAGLEPALRALIAQEARRATSLPAGAVQASLKTLQALTVAALGSPLIGVAFTRWASEKATPRLAWHYLLCAMAAFASGVIHTGVDVIKSS